MSILYGIPETILVSKGHIPILWTQLLIKKSWLVTFHWIEPEILKHSNHSSIESAIKSITEIPGVKSFAPIEYQNPQFPILYKKYMESGEYTRKEFDDKMEELLGAYI